MTEVMNAFGMVTENKFRSIVAFLMIPILFTFCFACTAQSIATTTENILNEVGPALQIVVSLLPLLTGKNIPTNVVQQVNAWIPRVETDVTQLNSLISQYQNDLATNTGAAAQINSLIATTQQDITSILPVFQVVDQATQNKIVQIVTAIAAGVTSVENIIAAAEGKVSVRKALKVGKAIGIKDKKSYQQVVRFALHVPTGDAVVDAATAQIKF